MKAKKFKHLSFEDRCVIEEFLNRNFNFTQKETDEGSKLLWLDISDALKLIKESENKLVSSKYESVYHTKFIVRRDYEILKYQILI